MNAPITIETEAQALVSQEDTNAAGMLQIAQSYEIDSPEMAEAAAEELGSIKAKIKELDEQRKSMTRPLDEAKRRIMDLFERPLSVLRKAEDVLKLSIGNWQAAERARMEAERKAAEEAQRKLAEEARKAAEAAAAKAKEAEAAGDMLAAVEAEQEAAQAAQTAEVITHMAPAVVAPAAKLAGVSSREDWKADVVDLLALVKAVAAGEASIELLEPNTKVINQRVKALKAEFKVPGIRTYTQAVVSARAKV